MENTDDLSQRVIPKTRTQFPAFWNEEWLRRAIDEVDRTAMSPDERFAYEKRIAQNAMAVYGERKRVTQAVQKMLLSGKLTPAEIADFCEVSVDFVQGIQQQLNTEK
jgi:hypothetical protein